MSCLNPEAAHRMTFQQLRVFLAVGECSSFQIASTRLHLTPPAVSKIVRELEEELGVELLLRGPSGVVLTAPGSALLAHSRGLMEGLQNAREDIAHATAGEGENFTIAVSPVMGMMPSFADALCELRERDPKSKVRILELSGPEALERMRAGTVDIALTVHGGSEGGDLVSGLLCERSTSIVVRRGHPFATARHLAELMDLEWIALDPVNTSESPFRQLFEANDLPLPRRITEFSSPLLAILLVERSDAALVLADESIDTPDFDSQYLRIDIGEPPPPLHVFIVHRREVSLSRTALRFINILKARVT